MIYKPREDSTLLEHYVRLYAKSSVLDMGTGSGIQAITAAHNNKVSSVLATDVQEEVIELCNKNIKNKKIRFSTSNLFENIKNKKFLESHIKHILEMIVKGESMEKAIVFEKGYENVIEEKIARIIKEKPGLSLNAYMGLIMKEFKGKVSGKWVMEIIKKVLK